MIKRIALLLSALLATSAYSVPAADTHDFSFANCAPEETLLFLEAASLTELRESWGKTPYARLWNDPAFAPFWQPGRDKIAKMRGEIEQKRGISVEELKQMFPGRACVYMSDLRYALDQARQMAYKEINTGVIVRMAPGSEERARSLIEEHILGQLPGNAERSVEEFRGVKIYTSVFLQSTDKAADTADKKQRPGPEADRAQRQTIDSGLSVPPEGTAEYHYEYAFVDDVAFLLEGQRAFMKKTLANYFAAKEGRPAETSLGGTENFRRFLALADGRPDILGYANIQRLLQQVRTDPFWEKAMGIRTLALSELRGAGIALRFTADATEFRVALTASPRPVGVASLLIRETRNDFSSLRLAPGDAWSWSSVSFNFAQLFRIVRDTATEIDPQGWQSAAGMLDQIRQQTGTDFEKDILEAAGDELATYTRPPAGALANLAQPGINNPTAPRQALIISLNRGDGFGPKLARFMEAAMSLSGPPRQVRFKTEEFQSFTIYTLESQPVAAGPNAGPPAPAEPTISFAATPSHLIVTSDASELRDALRYMTGQGGANLESQAKFRSAVESLKPGSVGRSWQNSSELVKLFVTNMRANPLILMMLAQFVQPGAMPDPDAFARHFGQTVAGNYVSSDSCLIEGRVIYPAR